MKVETLVAGRELDRLVAEKVMGYTAACNRLGDCRHLFFPSENIAHAWRVIEKLETLHFQWTLHGNNPIRSFHDRKPCFEYWHYTNGKADRLGRAEADTVPLAVCLAALKAVK